MHDVVACGLVGGASVLLHPQKAELDRHVKHFGQSTPWNCCLLKLFLNGACGLGMEGDSTVEELPCQNIHINARNVTR